MKIRSLKITTLADNFVQRTGFLGQWGLSFFLEVMDGKGQEHKIVFDTGNNPRALLHNIERLKIDLHGVEYIILSHGHSDHTATTTEIVKRAGKAVKVIVHPHLFQPRYYVSRTGRKRRGGVPEGEGITEIEKAGGHVVQTAKPVEVCPGLWTTGQIPRVSAFEKISESVNGGRRLIVVGETEINDEILDDQALWMDVEDVGPIVVTGCAHSGVINTLLHVKTLAEFRGFYGLIGGTHLVGRNDAYLSKTIEELTKYDLRLLSPCHCTGFKAATRLYQAFPRGFVLNFSGRIIEVGKDPEPRVV